MMSIVMPFLFLCRMRDTLVLTMRMFQNKVMLCVTIYFKNTYTVLLHTFPWVLLMTIRELLGITLLSLLDRPIRHTFNCRLTTCRFAGEY